MLIAGAYGAGSVMIKVEKRPTERTERSEMFKNPDFGSHPQPPILLDGTFYSQYTINDGATGWWR